MSDCPKIYLKVHWSLIVHQNWYKMNTINSRTMWKYTLTCHSFCNAISKSLKKQIICLKTEKKLLHQCSKHDNTKCNYALKMDSTSPCNKDDKTMPFNADNWKLCYAQQHAPHTCRSTANKRTHTRTHVHEEKLHTMTTMEQLHLLNKL